MARAEAERLAESVPREPYYAGRWRAARDAAAFDVVDPVTERCLATVAEAGFFKKFADRDFMRIAFLLAKKSYDEGGCPIGAVIIDRLTRQIVGKGHNTLIQENDPYNHGETSAVRDAGRLDFS